MVQLQVAHTCTQHFRSHLSRSSNSAHGFHGIGSRLLSRESRSGRQLVNTPSFCWRQIRDYSAFSHAELNTRKNELKRCFSWTIAKKQICHYASVSYWLNPIISGYCGKCQSNNYAKGSFYQNRRHLQTLGGKIGKLRHVDKLHHGIPRISRALAADTLPALGTGHAAANWHHGKQGTRHLQQSTGQQIPLGDKWKPGTIPQVDSVPEKIGDFEDRLFEYLSDNQGRLQIINFKQALKCTGLRESDPRLRECIQALQRYQTTQREENGQDGFYIDKESFKECITQNIVVIAKAFRNQFVLPEFKTFCESVDDIYWKARDNISGDVATYIPQLARYNPNLWGVSVCTVDGQRYSVGDVNVPFCLQSVSKPLTYAMVLDEMSPHVVHQYVGHEPSGLSFNKIYLDYKDKPHNPMVNAGAIVVCSLLKQQLNLADRFDYVSQLLKRLAGGEYLSFNNSVFLSERETADRNFAIGYYMREKKCFPAGTNLMEVLDFYFQLCSIEITAESGSVMAATLANGGICPITGDKVFSAPAVRDTLSLMHSCGMYDYSGEFAFKVGLPAKSGVSGAVMLVVPNKMGFCLWSPALDGWGNSVRGVQFSKDLVSKFNFHHYDNLKFTPKKIDPCKQVVEARATEVVNLLFSAYNSDVSALRRFALRDVNMDQADYDGRTALHIGAAEGHESVVKFLLEKCSCSPFVIDRWGFTPLDDAKRFNHHAVAEILAEAMKNYKSEDELQNLNGKKSGLIEGMYTLDESSTIAASEDYAYTHNDDKEK